MSGFIAPGEKQKIEITFIPTQEKAYEIKFLLSIKENPKNFSIAAKGLGVSINLQVSPQQIQIGPILAYNQFAYQVLQVKNPTNYDTELYSLQLDA